MDKLLKNATSHFNLGMIIFTIMLYFFLLVGKTNFKLFGFEFTMILLTAVFFTSGIRKNQKNVISFILLYQLLAWFVLFVFGMDELPYDPWNYLYASNYILDNYSFWGEGLIDLITKEAGTIPGMDANDVGYMLFFTPLHAIFGIDIAKAFLIIIKIAFHLGTCSILYKMMRKYFDNSSAILVTVLFGINSYATYFFACELKENICTFATLLATHRMLRQIEKPNLQNFLLFAICVLWTYGFRGTFPYYYIVAYVLYINLHRLPGFITRYLFVFFLIFTYFGTNAILMLSPGAAGMVQDRMEQFDDKGAIFTYLNFINAFISPYPALTDANQNANQDIVTFAIANISFAFFALLGIYQATKLKMSKLYPIAFVFLFNAMMLITVGFAMNARYTYPFTPLYYMFIPLGLKYFYKKKVWINAYMIFAVLITYYYNYR